MKLNIRLFATLKALAKTNQIAVELEHAQPRVSDLLAVLTREQPALEPSLRSVLVAVNNEYAFSDQLLAESDEIALFPPVSGG